MSRSGRILGRYLARIGHVGVLCAAVVALLGCNATFVAEKAVITATPPSAVVPTAVTAQDDGWHTVAAGIQRREIDLGQYAGGAVPVVRIDPASVAFRVVYRPGKPLSLSDWGAQLPDAEVIVNAAFFDDTDQALGLLVSDGQYFGQSYSGFGGMFQVSQSGVRVRSLVSEPYYGETLLQAVQAFPMLIETGGVLARQGDGFDEKDRRTWIGQDFQGRILIGMSPYNLSLADLQAWLLESGLDLNIAFGLDGGRSSGLLVREAGAADLFYPAYDQLPSVIAVYSP